MNLYIKCNFFAVFSQNVLTAARKSFDLFFLRYPYCYGYWKKYADLEKKHGNIQVAEEVNVSFHLPRIYINSGPRRVVKTSCSKS